MNKKELRDIILKTLEKEGGAAGLKALTKASNTSKKDLKKSLSKMSGVKQHQDGDYISTPINELENQIVEMVNEKLCKKGKAYIAKRKRAGEKSSAYLSGRAVRVCKGQIKGENIEEKEDYVVVDKRNLRPLMMNYGGGQFYEKWSTEEKAQADADELNRAYQKTYGAVEGPHVVMYKSDYFEEKRKQEKNSKDLDEINMSIEEILDVEVIDENIMEAKYKGKTVTLNKPMRGDSKKFKVYVNSGKKNADGSIKVKKVNFGHGGTSAKRPTMRIRKSNPKRRKAFRARHRCDNPGPKTMARYWSCKKW